MRTYAQKPKAMQQTKSAKSTKFVRTLSGQTRNVHSILQLQRTIGNQAVQRLLQSNAEEFQARLATIASTCFGHDFSRIRIFSPSPVEVQPKLTVSAPGDMYEQEADRVADQVMRMPEPQPKQECTCGGGCPICQAEKTNKEGQFLHTVRSQTTNVGETPAPPLLHAVLRSFGQPLEAPTKAFFEPRFGYDFSHVRVHTDAKAVESARVVNALAYTVGRHIVFGAGRYAPCTREGRHLLAHELTHVAQQGGKQETMQRQQTTDMSPATDEDRREFVQDTIDFLNTSASFFSDQRISRKQALFEKLIKKWYLVVVERERMIDSDLGGDAALKNALRTAYTAAIRVLMNRAALVFGKSENDLYRENTGRIPMWAWQTAHHLEPGFSTPIAEGRSVDLSTGNVTFSTNGFDVTIAPDTTDRKLGNKAETRINLKWRSPRYRYQNQEGQSIVTSFTAPRPVTVRIQTFYGPGVTATSPSSYGRGTTPEDIAGGRVTPQSTTVGFHEGSHGLAYVEFLESNPAPQFTGAVGMTTAEFQTAITQWNNDLEQYLDSIEEFSTRHTDCVGTTIDQYNQAQATHNTSVAIVCPP